MKKYILCTCICVLLTGLSGIASAKSTLGGIIFTDFYWQSIDSNIAGSEKDFDRVKIELPNMSRLRAKWTNEDDLTMYIEYGFGGSSAATGTKLRHAWGKWDFSTTGQILAGHTTSPFSPLFPSQTIGNNASESHNVGKGYGEVSSGRAPQVRYTYKFLNRRGAIAIALLDPNRTDNIDNDVGGEKSSTLPRIDIGMAFRTYNLQIFPGVFYQKSDYDDANISDDSVTSWGASLGVKGGSGAWLYSAEINKGQNMRNANLSIGSSAASQAGGAYLFQDSDGLTRLADTDNTSAWFDVGYKFRAGELKGTVHFIAGRMESDRSDSGQALIDLDYKSTMYGISVPIDLPRIAKGFRVRPEIFYYDNDNDNGTNIDNVIQVNGREIITGVQLQYTF